MIKVAKKQHSYNVFKSFLDAQASLAPTHVSLSVGWLVGDTFEFPLLLNISVQQSSLMSISYFIKIEGVFVCLCFSESVFSESVFSESVFSECIFFKSVFS